MNYRTSFKMIKILPVLLVVFSLVISLFVPQVSAQITNPSIGNLGGVGNANAAEARSGAIFALYFITLWRGIITAGGILVFVFFIWGAIEWISAGGDSSKVTKARDRITQSLIGFILLVSSAILIAFIGKLFFGDTLDFFNLVIPTPISQELPPAIPDSNPKMKPF